MSGIKDLEVFNKMCKPVPNQDVMLCCNVNIRDAVACGALKDGADIETIDAKLYLKHKMHKVKEAYELVE